MSLIANALRQIKPQIKNSSFIAGVIEAGLKAADPHETVGSNLSFKEGIIRVSGMDYELSPNSSVILIALGKAAPAMTDTAIRILGNSIKSGVCVYKHDPAGFCHWSNVESISGNHPVPGKDSLVAGQTIKECVSKVRADDLVLLLISGGGSSLATLPVAGIDLRQIQELTTTLLHSGASINEINSVRKHVDLLKGGGLLKMAQPARVEALVLSDVVGDPLDVIASGPAFPDSSTFSDAFKVVNSAQGFGVIPSSIYSLLEKGINGEISETLKKEDRFASFARHTIIGSNRISCLSAMETARSLGLSAEILTTTLVGEASEAGAMLAQKAVENQNRRRPFVLISGGETTVHVRGSGKGGRNLEVALGSVRGMVDTRETYLVTFATDGEDGPTDSAGAVVTRDTLARGMAVGLDPQEYLNNNDAYSYFQRIDQLVRTGPTGTNVNDISLIFGF